MSLAGTLRRSTYLLDFLYSFQFGLVLFFNSSFLKSREFTEHEIGFVFAAAYALAIVLFLLAPRLLPRFGNRNLFVFGAAATGLLFATLAVAQGTAVIALFIGALALSLTLYLSLDLFLETASADEGKTGRRRGLFNALKNGAFIAAQLAAGILLVGGFTPLYLTASIVLFATALLARTLMRAFRDKRYERPKWLPVFRRLARSRDLRDVFYLQFLLRLFYAVMVIYTPVYLHQYMGLPLGNLGAIFAIMLVPFIILEVPLGRMEDLRWGEREILVFGSLCIAAATALISFVSSPSVIVWGAVLFATRIGAVMLEIGSEAYFFKHVDGRNSGEVSAFRMLFPLAYIIGPLAASLFLAVLPLQFLFLALAAVMATGALAARRLNDTH